MYARPRATYSRTTRALDGREADKGRGSPRGIGEHGCVSILLCTVVVYFEVAVSTSTTRMNDTFRDTLVVEAMYLLECNLIFEQGRPHMCPVLSFQPVDNLSHKGVTEGHKNRTDQLSVSDT